MDEKNVLEMALPDPVLSALDLPFQSRFYPCGFPLDIASDSVDVIESAAEGWGEFTQQFDARPARMHIAVAKGSDEPLPAQSVVRSREHLMMYVANAENFMLCDFEKSFGFAWTTQSVARDHALLRYRFLIAGGLTLIEQQSCASLHCGLVVRNGRGVALLGDSFAGKSTLSYACARAGWGFASDDGVFLVRDRSDRYAMGDPYSLRLREDARLLFPELQDRLAAARPNGKIAMQIFTRSLPIQTLQGCTIDHIVFLRRNAVGAARVQPYPKDEALEWCQRYSTFGTWETRQAQWRCYERLLSAGIWELQYHDLDDAIARLERLVDSGD
ncbi:MAG TPA: hypothetical protein VKT81_16205 [Bryobacteraceae bacterium]|nr:hypothetical protein [Bryobacteraceae bacterium]